MAVSLILVFFSSIIVRKQNAVASVFRLLFSSQFGPRWSTTRTSDSAAALPIQSSTDDARFEHHPHLCRRRCLPGQGRDLPRRGAPWPSRQRRGGPVHPGTAGPADRAGGGGVRDGWRRWLGRGGGPERGLWWPR